MVLAAAARVKNYHMTSKSAALLPCDGEHEGKGITILPMNTTIPDGASIPQPPMNVRDFVSDQKGKLDG